MADRALDAREVGDNVYADFAVHFTLSRMRADRDGRIAIGQLRDLLRDLPFAGTLAPSLIRLEEQGVVRLVFDTSDGDPMTEILRARITHVELRVPV